MVSNTALVSGVHQSDSVTHVHNPFLYSFSSVYAITKYCREFPVLSSRELVISYLYFVWQCVCVCLNLPFVPFNPLYEFHCCWFMSCHIWNSPPLFLWKLFQLHPLLLMNYYDSCSKETMASFVFQMSLVYTVAFVSVQHEISSSGRLALNHRASSS